MPEPIIAAVKPCLVNLDKGRTYSWCACGRSRQQPFCDGSHKGTGIEPVRFVAQKSEEALFCACKRTKNPPYCDGSHNALKGAYVSSELDETTVDAPIVPRAGEGHPTSALDGGSFVRTVNPSLASSRGPLSLTSVIGASDGAHLLSLFRATVKTGKSQPLHFANAEVAAFVVAGALDFWISGVRHHASAETGVLILIGESLQLENHHTEEAVLMLTVCPARDEPSWSSPTNDSTPGPSARAFGVDPSLRRTMADRFYQVLNGPENGSREITQFIGEIPKSRAEPHQHLYEEAIVILSGEGYMRTGTRRAAVAPGDVIFLPRKQVHSLECVSEGGMRLMGAFYPAGSPAVNY